LLSCKQLPSDNRRVLLSLFSSFRRSVDMEAERQRLAAQVANKASLPVEVRRNAKDFNCLVAARCFEAGECVLQLDGPVVSAPTRTSIELATDRHVEDKLGQFVNHSFDPTTVVEKTGSRLVALRRIQKGEEITFDYNVNETDMACPFFDKETLAPVLGRGSQESQH
jgi:hypothetical protein